MTQTQRKPSIRDLTKEEQERLGYAIQRAWGAIADDIEVAFENERKKLTKRVIIECTLDADRVLNLGTPYITVVKSGKPIRIPDPAFQKLYDRFVQLEWEAMCRFAAKWIP